MMDTTALDLDWCNVIQLLKNLHNGKRLRLKDGSSLAMSEDLVIGIIAKDVDGNELDKVMPLFEDLKRIQALLEKNDIGIIIP
mgnify:CR=1 FL=1